MDELIRVYGLKIRAIKGSQELSHEQDRFSDKIYGKIRIAKNMNTQTTSVAYSSFGRTGNRGNNLERIPLPMFSGDYGAWADFRRGFRAMLGLCDPPIEMVPLRTALPEAAMGFIIGVTNPTEAWFILEDSTATGR